MLLSGKCHCGNIELELDWRGDPPEIPARACGCTFCVKHGNVWTSQLGAKLTVFVRDESRVSRYQQGTETAVFHVCSRCGAVPIVTSEIDGALYAVVNVNTLEGIDPAWLQRSGASFDGETVEERLARRRRGWIAGVRFGARRDG